MEDFFNAIRCNNEKDNNTIKQMSPLVLAYVGDAVYELFVRTIIVSKNDIPVNKLHAKSVSFVKAKSQSAAVHKITELLTPDEKDIVRRGRNVKSGTLPKHADVDEYRYATGLESLIGYLYLCGQYARLVQVLEVCISMIDNEGLPDK